MKITILLFAALAAATSTRAQQYGVLDVIESDDPVASLDLGEDLVRGLNHPWTSLSAPLVRPDTGAVAEGVGRIGWRVPDYAVDRFWAEVRDGRLYLVLLDFSEEGPDFEGYTGRLRERHGAPGRDGFYSAATLRMPYDLAVDAEAHALTFRAVGDQTVPADAPLPIQFRAVPLPPREEPPPRDTTQIYEVTESPPEIVNGTPALASHVIYPEDARADGVSGTVLVQFIINTNGTTSDHVVLRSPDPRLNAAAIEAVRQTRFWPGHQDGLPVRTRFTVSVQFTL